MARRKSTPLTPKAGVSRRRKRFGCGGKINK